MCLLRLLWRKQWDLPCRKREMSTLEEGGTTQGGGKSFLRLPQGGGKCLFRGSPMKGNVSYKGPLSPLGIDLSFNQP